MKPAWMPPSSPRLPSLFKLVGLIITLHVLLYTVGNIYSPEEERFTVPSVAIPESLKPGSWKLPTSFSHKNVSNSTESNVTASEPGVDPGSLNETSTELVDYQNVGEDYVDPSTNWTTTPARADIGKVTILFGGTNPTYERAVRTHEVHNKRFGYPLHILRHGILSDVWTKPAYILSLLLKELSKPEHERLKWLLYAFHFISSS